MAKAEIHPKYHPEARVVCACGNSWTVGATVPEIRTDICSKCHPFYTGEQRIVDTAGQVDRFIKKLERRDQIRSEVQEREDARSSLDQPIQVLELGPRVDTILVEAGVKTVGDALARLEEDEQGLADLKGFGIKSLATLKKRLRARGLVLSTSEVGAAEVAAEPSGEAAA